MSVTAVKSLEEFKSIISKDKYTVFDFWATWCGPCRVISPVFEKFASSFATIEFFKVDVDEQPEIAQEVGISAMPTFILFKNGDKISDFTGAVPNGLEKMLQQAH